VGVPIKEEKTAYAQTTMTCLGIELDLLSFACCVVQPDRTFLRRLIFDESCQVLITYAFILAT
jgi:hypothetical protein